MKFPNQIVSSHSCLIIALYVIKDKVTLTYAHIIATRRPTDWY